jgi:hypothetical protein
VKLIDKNSVVSDTIEIKVQKVVKLARQAIQIFTTNGCTSLEIL